MTFKSVTVSAVALLMIGACGSDDKAKSGADDSDAFKNADVACSSLESMPEPPRSDIAYPDSVCAEGVCREGGCDPLGRCSPACNAWRMRGEVSFHAAPLSDQLDIGFPDVSARPAADSDVCGGTRYMTSSTAGEVNCCQRADNLTAERPMLKLSGLKMSRPLTFALPAVSESNQLAIEYGLYNIVLGLSSVVDGDLTVTMGSGLPNRDGSFYPIAGSFQSAGKTFNDDGTWNAQLGVPGLLSTGKDGRRLHVGPSSADEDLRILLWLDDTLDFVRLVLPLRSVEYDLPLSDDLNCAGARTAGGTFELVGTVDGYLPLESARETQVYVTRDEGNSVNLCTLTSTAASCDKDVRKWSK